ncbi:MAG: SUMF1/EgtB/PvdO family nonheme iron enzyme [Candidatus Sulfotelmatobacter sp.]
MRPHLLLLCIGLAIVSACAAQVDLCPLLSAYQGGGGLPDPAAQEARIFLDSVDRVVGAPTGILLLPSSSALVRKRAAAQVCGSARTERWVFYDEAYLSSLSPNARHFVLAHEAAHHISNDSAHASSWSKEMELRADYSAAIWLTRLGVTRDQLLEAFEELAFPSESVGGYPTRSERRERVIEGIAYAQPVPTPSTAPVGTVRGHPRDGLKYVWIPAGTFMMGCSSLDSECYANERPAHQVAITRGFWIGQTPVTQEAYQRVTGKNTSHFKGEGLPVDHITWEEAKRYCETIGMRLPTEAEWEYAARAGTPGARYDDVDSVAWYNGNSSGQTHPVGLEEPNAWKLYDMLGNVWQWTADWYGDKYYDQREEQDPQGPPAGLSRTFRGGSWDSFPRSVRASYRGSGEPGFDEYSFGARCVGETVP